MNEIEFENQLRSIARKMDYPRTPDIAGPVMTRLRRARFVSLARGATPLSAGRRLAWSLTIILVLLSSLMLIPPVRAAILEFIQIGIVRIFPQNVEPTVEVVTTPTPQSVMPSTATPGDSSPLLISFLDQIAGETKLASAQEAVPYPILLPTHPEGLGGPDHVYVQDAEGAMTIVVWTDPEQPEHVTMSLHFIPAGHWAIKKFGPVTIQEIEVDGQSAVWAVGPYPLLMQNGSIQVERLIDGHVLIWADGQMTYRLETDLPLEEAVKVAESLEPIP